MFHKLVLTIVFAFAVGLVGCRSCWGPNDHCQPTFVPEAGDECMGELYRNGSILGGMERRDGGCSGCGGSANGECSSCSGSDTSQANYEMTDYETQNVAPQSYSDYSQAGPTEALPPRGGAPVDGNSTETIPTPRPNAPVVPGQGQGSIEDYLPDSTGTLPDNFPLGGEEI